MRKILCLVCILYPTFLFAQAGSEIYLFDFEIRKGVPVLSNPVNVSNHIGYDNQPSFHPEKPILYYSSFDAQGRSDIKAYNYDNKQASNFTLTPEKEYSPTVTPDGKFISCIIQRDNGKQDLGKYPIDGGDPILLVNDRTVGYHAWISPAALLLFVLGEGEGNSLQEYSLLGQAPVLVAKSIGRSLHAIPGEKALSFVSKADPNAWKIKRFDPITRSIADLAPTLPGREDLTWTKNGLLLMSDGTKLFWYEPKSSTSWEEIKQESFPFMKGVTRLAIDGKNKRLAVVVSE